MRGRLQSYRQRGPGHGMGRWVASSVKILILLILAGMWMGVNSVEEASKYSRGKIYLTPPQRPKPAFAEAFSHTPH